MNEALKNDVWRVWRSEIIRRTNETKTLESRRSVLESRSEERRKGKKGKIEDFKWLINYLNHKSKWISLSPFSRLLIWSRQRRKAQGEMKMKFPSPMARFSTRLVFPREWFTLRDWMPPCDTVLIGRSPRIFRERDSY